MKIVKHILIKCKTCGKEFDVRITDKRKYCSIECSRAAWKDSRNKSLLKTCLVCGEEFYIWKSRAKEGKGKCCSKKCCNEYMKTHSFLINNNPSKTEEGKKRLKEQNKGEKNRCWLGGLTPIRTQIYRSDIFKNWRDLVFQRDKYTCQKRGYKGKGLNAHHIKSFSDIMIENNIKSLNDAYKCDELGNIDNGVTLCKNCHQETDNYGWRQMWNRKCI